jgi:hypothetical protein
MDTAWSDLVPQARYAIVQQLVEDVTRTPSRP